jgi:hypothetical protein
LLTNLTFLEAVGYDFEVEEDKGEGLMLQMEEAFQPGYMDKTQVSLHEGESIK